MYVPTLRTRSEYPTSHFTWSVRPYICTLNSRHFPYRTSHTTCVCTLSTSLVKRVIISIRINRMTRSRKFRACTTTNELTLYSELKPYSLDDERLSEDTQRRHTHQTDHKLEKCPRIQTHQDAGMKIDLIHTPPFRIQCNRHGSVDEWPNRHPIWPQHKVCLSWYK